MSELAKMTWPEARAAFGPRSVAILPVGSTEPHGPHLPLDTDVTIATAMAARTVERLRRRTRAPNALVEPTDEEVITAIDAHASSRS